MTLPQPSFPCPAAVYSLQPKFDNPSSGLDVACCMACQSPRDPQKVSMLHAEAALLAYAKRPPWNTCQVVLKGLGELEQMEDDR